jgi:hypothetical protein
MLKIIGDVNLYPNNIYISVNLHVYDVRPWINGKFVENFQKFNINKKKF